MPKEEWGTKRVCPDTGKRFYDLGRNPAVSPYTGKSVELDTGKTTRTMVADKADKETQKKKAAEDELLEDGRHRRGRRRRCRSRGRCARR